MIQLLRSLIQVSHPIKSINVPSPLFDQGHSTKTPSATPHLPVHQPPSLSMVSKANPGQNQLYGMAYPSGSALYIFGPTGPSFGVFQVEIDNSVIGIYNASTTVNTYDSLLFFTTHLDSSIQHQAVLTNQVDGMMFALDYVIAVQGDSSTASGAPNGETGTTVVPVAGQTATAIIATARTAVPPGTETSIPPAAITSSPQTATAVFPSSAPAQSTVPGASAQGTTVANGNGSAGAVIGGILGGLAALVSIYIGPTSLSLHRLHLPLHISPS